MDVCISLGNMWVPATCTQKQNDRCICVVKYSKLAASLNLVSLTLSLPPERVQSDDVPEVFGINTFPPVEQCDKVPLEKGHSRLPLSSASELSSASSDLIYDEKLEANLSGQIDFDLFPDTEEDSNQTGTQLTPKGTFTFTDIVETVRGCLRDIFDTQTLEALIQNDFLQLDYNFFETRRQDLGFHPLCSDEQWSILYRHYWICDGVKVFNKRTDSRIDMTDLFPTYPATFDLSTNRVTINSSASGSVQRSFCLVPSDGDYLVHIFDDVSEPIFADMLVNWRAVPTTNTAPYKVLHDAR